jgi:hypothetical protein
MVGKTFPIFKIILSGNYLFFLQEIFFFKEFFFIFYYTVIYVKSCKIFMFLLEFHFKPAW